MLNPVLAMLIGIIVMMLLIIFTKMHAFPSLIISAVLIAVLAMPFGDVTTLSQCISTVTAGFGSTMTSIGIVIGFGCIMGIFLEKSGAAKCMALTILKAVGLFTCVLPTVPSRVSSSDTSAGVKNSPPDLPALLAYIVIRYS